MREYRYKTVVIGGGPAGTGLLFNAIRKKELKEFLNSGVAFIEKSDSLVCGTIGKYIINSDTEGRVFLECLADSNDIFSSTQTLKITKLISDRSTASVPLDWVGQYLRSLGNDLKEQVQKHSASNLFFHSTALSIHKDNSGSFHVKVKTTNGNGEKEFWIRTGSVVFAMGGRQDRHGIIDRDLTSSLNLKSYDNKIITSDVLFTEAGSRRAKNIILRSGKQKIVIIGSSHSALSSVYIMLNKMEGIFFGENDITLMHRKKFKIFYPDKQQALNEGYHDFEDKDICPLTQKVYRLGGIRLDSRELLKKITGINNEKEKRVQLVQICRDGANSADLKNLLDNASLIIPAFGYRPRTVPIYDQGGNAVDLLCNYGGALVNDNCQVLDSAANVIAGVYGIGLASGFVPKGKLGGEPGFTGQTNGLWLYQNGVGEIIYNRLR